jgi:dTDP-glucose 4,6-dehydratase
MKTALVAGGAGFIGSHLCDFLVAQKYRILIVDNCVTGDRANIQHLLELKDQVLFLEADIRRPFREWLDAKWVREIDEIYNLASPASPIDFARMPSFILTTASQGHQNLLELAREGQGQSCRILFASTSEVYGDPLEHPQKESYWGNVNSIGERSCYDEAKRYGEAITMAYMREFKIPTRIIRIFNTYGPRMRPSDGRVICNFFSQGLRGESLTIYGTGEQTRSFCYVSDLVRGVWNLMQSEVTTPVNVGNPNEITILEIAKTVNQLTQNQQPLAFRPLPQDDPQRRRPDITRARQQLGWEPEVALADGLRHTLEFFRASLAQR